MLHAACRSQCKRQSDAATSAAEFSLVALRAELEKKAQEIVRLEGEHQTAFISSLSVSMFSLHHRGFLSQLHSAFTTTAAPLHPPPLLLCRCLHCIVSTTPVHSPCIRCAAVPAGELRERDSSIKVFQTSNTALQQQLDALQRQLTSPEATTPSFVAKQRQQLAAAASAQAGLQAENAQLRQELLELRLALESNRGLGSRGGSKSGAKGSTAAGAADLVVEEAEEDALAAAERLLSGDGDEDGAADWKVAEIERLQGENRQLHAKVSSCAHTFYRLPFGQGKQCVKDLRASECDPLGYNPQCCPVPVKFHAALCIALLCWGAHKRGGLPSPRCCHRLLC